MTPTLILFVALLWTLPASAAVLTYRAHDSSMENVKASADRAIENVFGQTELQPQADA